MPNSSRFEVEDPRFRQPVVEEPARRESPARPPLPEPPVRGRSCLKGCMFVLLVLVALIAIGLFWVSRHWRDWASRFGDAAFGQALEATELPEQEKDEIRDQVARLTQAFRQGQIDDREVWLILQQIVHSPAMTSLAASAIQRKYVTDSGLTAEEKADGEQTLRRFLRGTIDGDIDEQGMESAMSHVADRTDQGSWQLRDQVTDDQLRAFFQEAKLQADEADVAAEPEDVDPSEEIRRIIDDALIANPRRLGR